MISANTTMLAGELSKWMMRNAGEADAVRSLVALKPDETMNPTQASAVDSIKALASEKFQWGITIADALAAATMACRFGQPR